jgi:hypothetical protein
MFLEVMRFWHIVALSAIVNLVKSTTPHEDNKKPVHNPTETTALDTTAEVPKVTERRPTKKPKENGGKESIESLNFSQRMKILFRILITRSNARYSPNSFIKYLLSLKNTEDLYKSLIDFPAKVLAHSSTTGNVEKDVSKHIPWVDIMKKWPHRVSDKLKAALGSANKDPAAEYFFVSVIGFVGLIKNPLDRELSENMISEMISLKIKQYDEYMQYLVYFLMATPAFGLQSIAVISRQKSDERILTGILSLMDLSCFIKGFATSVEPVLKNLELETIAMLFNSKYINNVFPQITGSMRFVNIRKSNKKKDESFINNVFIPEGIPPSVLDDILKILGYDSNTDSFKAIGRDDDDIISVSITSLISDEPLKSQIMSVVVTWLREYFKVKSERVVRQILETGLIVKEATKNE